MTSGTVTYEFENQARAKGCKLICGVDEAGRGPLAGAVFAAAVILPDGLLDIGLNDSKKLSEKRREALFDVICSEAVSFNVAIADEREIDEINILNAAMLAMRRAVAGLDIPPDFVLVDGNKAPGTGIEEMCIIKGDAKSVSIAAASVLAKVSRDRYMLELAEKYPEYCFERHKGYGTALHYEMIEKHGVSPVHRRTFLKKILDK